MIEMNYSFNTKISFENGLTVSFSISEGNYCANKNNEEKPLTTPYSDGVKERKCKDCEVAVFNKNGDFMEINQFLPESCSSDGTVAGWVNSNELLEIMNNVAKYTAA